MPRPEIAAPAPTPEAQLRQYVVVTTVLGLILFIGAMRMPAASVLGMPALIGAAIVSVLLGRSIGWRALLGPLAAVVIWAIGFALLISFATEPESDERGLSTLFAFLGIGFLLIAGEICVLAGCLWRAVSPPKPADAATAPAPGPITPDPSAPR